MNLTSTKSFHEKRTVEEQIEDRVNTNSVYVPLGSFEAIHRVSALEKSFPLSLSLKNSVQSTEASKLS